ncbi:hypothetical protein L873DRAFT_1119203 [Choiromyces venosus 120613-1]|uniref:Uncharacterized protein n=1 Tax=Choiromyces venosus 120613-1 TaxID=1336337 RepID=A0A3N4JM10_9PEZI|nr:hypothetical protein L873DRAFT_1119203 [Choiromyces venosus 120613-1]
MVTINYVRSCEGSARRHPISSFSTLRVRGFLLRPGGSPNQRPLSDFSRWLQSLYSYPRLQEIILRCFAPYSTPLGPAFFCFGY